MFLIGTNIYDVFHNSAALAGWRLFSFSLVNFGWYFVYFVLIPYFTKGYTLWTKVVHIKMIDADDQQLEIRQLCLHNSSLWMVMMGWMVVVSIAYWIFSAFNQAQSFLMGMLTFNTNSSLAGTVGFGIGVFMRVITVIIGLITGVILINILINRTTYAFVDSMSDTYMVLDKPSLETEVVVKTNTYLMNENQQKMPGMICEQEEIILTDNPLNNKNKGEKHDRQA